MGALALPGLLSIACAAPFDTQMIEGDPPAHGSQRTQALLANDWAQPEELAKLVAQDKTSSAFFGRAVAISEDGNTILIGADGARDESGVRGGAAYVFVRSGETWSLQQKLMAGNRATNARFGASVALSADGDTALIGASSTRQGSDLRAGAAYVFVRTGDSWTEEQELVSNDVAAGDELGAAVALSAGGNTALVAALSEDDGGTTNAMGAVYVFSRTGGAWSERQKLVASDRASRGFFGVSVALSAGGTTALIGSSQQSEGDTQVNGAAYVFTRTGATWSEQAKLLASDRATFDKFGQSVALSADGKTALIGAVGFGDPNPAAVHIGAAYLLRRTGPSWVEEQKLVSSREENPLWFGGSVALSADGHTALIGERGQDLSAGAAYVFTRVGTSLVEQQVLMASGGAPADRFGASVALSAGGETAVVGAMFEDDGDTSNNGAAHVFAPTVQE